MIRLTASACLLAAAALWTAPSVLAANAEQPFQNVDKSNDKGNDTGDRRVEDLNKGQLDQRPALGAAPAAVPPSDGTVK